jgi:AAA+ ATPase superfamily predicted ATPase
MQRPDRLFDREREWATLSRFLERGAPGLAIVRGRRRHGKSALLRALCDVSGAFYYQAIRGVPVEQRRDLARAWQRHVGGPEPAFATWDETISALLQLDTPAVVIDELPYLTESSPELESVIQRCLDQRRRDSTGPALVLCGSARAIMTRLLVGEAPLRGRAQLEIDIAPFDYRDVASFTKLAPPTAFAVHAVVGGVPGYLVDLLDRTYPSGPEDVDRWLTEVVAAPHRPLIHEARSLIDVEAGVRDSATYASILAAMAGGASRTGEIAGLLGRSTDAISHSLRALEALGFVTRSDDLLQRARPTWHIADPLLRCYGALFRSRWTLVEQEDRDRLRRAIAEPWRAQVLGPTLEGLTRQWVRRYAREESIGGLAVRVGRGTVNDPAARIRHEVDVVALDDTSRALMIGETKLRRLDRDDRGRLAHIRDLLQRTGRADEGTRLLLCSAESVAPEVTAHADAVAVDLDRLYDGS